MIRCKGVDMSIDEYCDMRQIPSRYRKIDELIKRGYIIETDFGYEEKEIFATTEWKYIGGILQSVY